MSTIIVGTPSWSPRLVVDEKLEAIKRQRAKEQEDLEERARAKKMLSALTEQEQMQIAYVPALIGEVVWLYAKCVTDHAKARSVPHLKKLCRAIDALRDAYIKGVQVCVDQRHRDDTAKKARRLMYDLEDEVVRPWLDMYSDAIKDEHPNEPYHYLRRDAHMCIALIKALKKHNNWSNALLADKLGAEHQAPLSKLYDVLEECMQACVSKCELPRLRLGEQQRIDAFLGRVREIKFTIEG